MVSYDTFSRDLESCTIKRVKSERQVFEAEREPLKPTIASVTPG